MPEGGFIKNAPLLIFILYLYFKPIFSVISPNLTSVPSRERIRSKSSLGIFSGSSTDRFIEKAASPKDGVLLLSAHFTTLEIGGRITSNKIPLTFMYRQHKNKLFDWMQKKSREGQTGGVIERKQVRSTIKALRNKKPVWYAADQDYGRKHSIFAPFFNIQAASITATRDFSKLGNAVVIPLFSYRKKNASGYYIELLEPIKNYPSDDPVKDATIINQVLETAILKAPEQYLWAHRRFKTRPEGEANFYK